MVSPEVRGTVEKGRAGFLVYLEFSKTFDSLSHTSFMTKLVTNGFSAKVGGKLSGLPGSESCDLGAKPS